MKFYKKHLARYLNRKLDKELERPPEQHEYTKIRLIIDLIAYLEEPRITMGEYLERSEPFLKKMQELQREKEE